MVYTSNAILTATLVLSAAAPILAAPVELYVDSGFSGVNHRARVHAVRAPVSPSTQPPATAEAPPAAAKKKPSTDITASLVGGGSAARASSLLGNLFDRASDDEIYLAARAGVDDTTTTEPASAASEPSPLKKTIVGSVVGGSTSAGLGNVFKHLWPVQ